VAPRGEPSSRWCAANAVPKDTCVPTRCGNHAQTQHTDGCGAALRSSTHLGWHSPFIPQICPMYGKSNAKDSNASQDPKAPQASLKIKIGAKASAGADGADETPTVRSPSRVYWRLITPRCAPVTAASLDWPWLKRLRYGCSALCSSSVRQMAARKMRSSRRSGQSPTRRTAQMRVHWRRRQGVTARAHVCGRRRAPRWWI
jgi:hypothetical protein